MDIGINPFEPAPSNRPKGGAKRRPRPTDRPTDREALRAGVLLNMRQQKWEEQKHEAILHGVTIRES